MKASLPHLAEAWVMYRSTLDLEEGIVQDRTVYQAEFDELRARYSETFNKAREIAWDDCLHTVAQGENKPDLELYYGLHNPYYVSEQQEDGYYLNLGE